MNKIMDFLKDKLSESDASWVLALLHDAGLTDSDDADTDGAPTPAMDAAFRAKYPSDTRILAGGSADEQRARDILARRAPMMQRPSPTAVKRSNLAADAIEGFDRRYPAASHIRVL